MRDRKKHRRLRIGGQTRLLRKHRIRPDRIRPVQIAVLLPHRAIIAIDHGEHSFQRPLDPRGLYEIALFRATQGPAQRRSIDKLRSAPAAEFLVPRFIVDEVQDALALGIAQTRGKRSRPLAAAVVGIDHRRRISHSLFKNGNEVLG
jgi:hypothetical protein